jgi:glutamate-1-semialdehyde 2,1-aminomutase
VKFDRSEKLFAKSSEVLVGGVNSPVRAFRSVGGVPVFITEASGSKLTDADGNEYIDCIGAWGPMILGHAHPEVTAAIQKAVGRGVGFGTCAEVEQELAREVISRFPEIEKLRFVNSGTEATMSAVRLARGVTGRAKAIKFAGCYHGHGDIFLIKAGSGALTFGAPDSAGVTPGTAADTLIADFNDLESVSKLFEENSGEIAVVIVEAVAGNMGVVPPAKGFLEGLRKLCDANGALLIFDEVMTGFRVARGGAQQLYGVKPDITCLGKIVGGGMPVGAYGASAKIMDNLSPLGPVYQAGTLSGNPPSMTAGLTTLRLLDDELYHKLETKCARLAEALNEAAKESGVEAAINRVGSMLTVFFTAGPVTSFDTAQKTDAARFGLFFHAMLEQGVFLPPSAFEAWFISAAHTDEDIDRIIAAAKNALKA